MNFIDHENTFSGSPESYSLITNQCLKGHEESYSIQASVADRYLHSQFEIQAQRTPDASAVRFQEQTLTYKGLNQRANQLAHCLQSQGIKPGTLVAVYLERSLDMVVAVMGILKAGGAYVPLDTALPEDRIKFILRDTQAHLILTQTSLKVAIAESDFTYLCLDADSLIWDGYPATNPGVCLDGENLAYVIYTSGSTGQPKGVMIPHRGIVNQLLWREQTFPLSSQDRVLQTIALSFDPSVWQIFWPLSCGAELVLAQPNGQKDPGYLVQAILQESISVIAVVPSLLRVLLDHPNFASCTCLKYVFCGGEALPTELVDRFFNQFAEGTALYNVYGPTEASIDTTFWFCKRGWQEAIAPIGYPIANVETHILDDQLQPVPVGASGELFIGGKGLATGYLNRPELTAERFITLHLGAHAQVQLYRTGDLVRLESDGVLTFIGRMDHQVKIRGFRIEPGEIEAVLRQHPAIAEAVVMVREMGANHQQLIAYFTSIETQTPAEEELRNYLLTSLPDYMVPTAFVRLETLPLNPNGKIDRQVLQAINPYPATIPSSETIADNNLEARLMAVWSDLLGIAVGVDDNFFKLGGNSLLAAQLCLKMEAELQRPIAPSLLFKHSTIASFVKQLNQGISPEVTSITLQQSQGDRPPLFFVNSQAYLRNLLPYLSSEQPVYGLNIFGLVERYQSGFEDLSLESLATQMVADICAIQPQGLYFLGAYCGDSRLTLEIAQQLEKLGHNIGLLLFIDVVWNEQQPGLSYYWKTLLRLGPGYLFQKIEEKYKTLDGIWHSHRLRHFPGEESSQMHHQSHQLQFHQQYYQRFHELSQQYQGAPFSGKISLLLSSEWLARHTPDLEQLAKGGLDLHEVYGYHHSLFNPPYVEKLADAIEACLQKAQDKENCSF